MRAAWLLPLVLVACSDGGGAAKPAPATSSAAAPTTAASGTAAPTTAAPTTPAPSPTAWPPAGVRMAVAREYAEFRTPTGNIACGLGNESASCEIREHTWRLPPRDPACEFDWVAGASVDAGDGVRIGLCRSDTVMGATRVLAYGTGIQVGDFACVSEQSGVTCRDGGTGGFVLSRTTARTIPY